MAEFIIFEPDYTVEGRHYTHSLIDWHAVIAGALVAIASGFVLNVVGAAIGASIFNPYAFASQNAAISVGGGLYVIFAQLVAFELGGYVAARSARHPDHFGGALSGGLVWSLAIVVAIVLATLAASSVAGGDALPAQVAAPISGASEAVVGQSADASALQAAENAADSLAAAAWWAVAAFGLGLAGAVAGGWLGAHHPVWTERPRLSARAPSALS